MEFGAATTTATLTKKLSNGYGVSGRSAYDGVFATPIKLGAPSFSSQFEDYREIFGSSGASLGSSIPILELPELNERKTVDDVWRSKLDYSMVFGGFGNLDAAVPFEELVAKPKEKSRFTNGASARRKVKSGEQSCWEDHINCSKENPVVSHSSNDAKRINMSYHKVNQGSENGTQGTTHVAQLHAVPAYTCVIEEVNSVKLNRAEKTIPVAQDTYSGSHCFEGRKEGGRRTKSFTDPSPENAKKQSSNNGVKAKNTSDSIGLFYDACEISKGSKGTHQVKEDGRHTKSFTDPSPDNAKKQSSNNEVKAKSTPDSVDLFYDACEISNGSNGTHKFKEAGRRTKSFTDLSPDNAKKQSSNNGVKAKNTSDSVDLFYDACEISNGSNGTHHVNVPPSETVAGNLDNHNVDALRSMATKCQASKSCTFEGAAGSDSPTYLDDMVDSNSAAAASVAALRKAIEEAQVRMMVAKESMRRKKEGFPDCVKRKSNINLKAGGKKEAKLAYKMVKPEEINTRQAFGTINALPQVSSEVGKPVMRIEQVRSDLGAKEMCVAEEAVQKAQKKPKVSQAEHKGEVERKEADHKGKDLELKEAAYTEKVPCTKYTGRNVSEEPEESDHTIEMVKNYWDRENDEENIHADNESGTCEELVHETKHRCQGGVDKTKLIQETLDHGKNDKGLKVNENGEVVNKFTPFNEPKDYDSNLGGQGLIENKEKVGCKPEESDKKFEGSIELEKCQKNLRAFQELGKGEKNILQEQKESEDKVKVFGELEECELTEFLDAIDNGGACNPDHPDSTSMEKEIGNLGCLEDPERRNESGFLDMNQEIEHSCQREATDNTFSNIYVQEILEDIVDHIHNDDTVYERNTKDNEFDGNGRVQDAHANEDELEGATQLMKENERERKDKKVLDVITESQTDPSYEEIQTKESDNTTEPSSSYDPDETEKLSKTRVADTIIENDETLEVTPEIYSCDVQDDIMVASNASIQHPEKYEEPESVQETNDFFEKHAGETSAFDQCAPELNETVNQMKNTYQTVTFEDVATSIGETGIKVRQNKDQCLEKAESDCDLAMLVEETIPESVEICKDAKEARIASDEETDETRSNSSSEEILFQNEHNIEASQIPCMSEWKSSPFKEEEVISMHSNPKESHQASVTMEEKEANGKPQKVELDKEHLKKIDEAKERKREREKEKLAVERAIREARERAFADARERATLSRQKNISGGRERQGKTTSQANEKTPAEKAAMETKLKAERAAVERATAEARARALERALSEKAATDARNKSDKPIAEKCLGASRDNGTKQNFHSKSFSYSVRDSTDVFDGANGDSAQRCKARSERHQRIGERVAKALAEKNMRDRLVQKEQEEKNRVAEVLDADVKRWSSGKAGNLRALLSTLQYILGPDSGWQPIPLTEIVTRTAVKKAYRKATLFVHPDKLQQRRASIQQKYTCEKVFDLLKEAWNRFNMEER